jgi:hypothetical protein
MEWGADAIFTLRNNQMAFQSYYKIPVAQTPAENCVAHNGSLIPVPGRDIMVQGWYQGGISVLDFTDPKRVKEIAFFDRGPVNGERMTMGGSWSAYWYNGRIISSEIARGLDVLELLPSGLISANELAAAKTVKMDYWNPQDQQKFVWPPSFALARSYLDQLERSKGLSATIIASTRKALDAAERQSGAARSKSLTQLSSQLSKAEGTDTPKIKLLAVAVKDLAGA